MTDEQSDHKLFSHILLSSFGCYEYAENMNSNSKNKTTLLRYESCYLKKYNFDVLVLLLDGPR